MARRRASTALTVYRSAPRISAPRPIIIRQSAPLQRRKGRRRRSGGGGVSGFLSGGGGIIAVGVTAAVIGMAESGGLLAKLPSIPVVGRKGALAIAAYYYSRHGGGSLSRDVAIAAAALAGYELGSKGSISGEDY